MCDIFLINKKFDFLNDGYIVLLNSTCMNMYAKSVDAEQSEKNFDRKAAVLLFRYVYDHLNYTDKTGFDKIQQCFINAKKNVTIDGFTILELVRSNGFSTIEYCEDAGVDVCIDAGVNAYVSGFRKQGKIRAYISHGVFKRCDLVAWSTIPEALPHPTTFPKYIQYLSQGNTFGKAKKEYQGPKGFHFRIEKHKLFSSNGLPIAW